MRRLIIAGGLYVSMAALVACGPEPAGEQQVWEHESWVMQIVELSEADQLALETAPKTAFAGVLSGELQQAINSNAIESTKVQLIRDKVDGEIVNDNPPTHQGWIYYEPTKLSDGSAYAPAVLCVSQSDPIEWIHCQDASELATRRLLKKQQSS